MIVGLTYTPSKLQRNVTSVLYFSIDKHMLELYCCYGVNRLTMQWQVLQHVYNWIVPHHPKGVQFKDDTVGKPYPMKHMQRCNRKEIQKRLDLETWMDDQLKELHDGEEVSSYHL